MMNPDLTFRIVLIVGFVVLLSIGLPYRVRSQATGEALDRRQEGLFMLATLRPIGLIYWLGIVSYVIDPGWMAWSSLPLPLSVRWMGAVLGALGEALIFWTFRTLGPNLTDTVVTRRSHTLVTGGPYRWVRHPFYDAAAVLVLATSLVAANWFLLVVGGLVFLLLFLRTRIEEAKLLARFGDSYRFYRDRTGRFLPRIAGTRPR